MSDTARLVELFVRATGAQRVLEIGTGTGASGLAIARALPVDGLLITLERDRAAATEARQRFHAAGYERQVTVMVGDAARYLHKLAGPFNLVFQDGDPAAFPVLHDRVVGLMAPGATIITHNMHAAGRYNEVLAADRRLATVALTLGAGVALSVRTAHQQAHGRLTSDDD